MSVVPHNRPAWSGEAGDAWEGSETSKRNIRPPPNKNTGSRIRSVRFKSSLSWSVLAVCVISFQKIYGLIGCHSDPAMFYEASEAILTFSPGRDGMGIESIPIGPRRPKNATTTNIKDQLASVRVRRGIIHIWQI